MIVNNFERCIKKMLSNRLISITSRHPLRFAKHMNRVTYAPLKKIKSIYRHTGELTSSVCNALEKFDAGCETCPRVRGLANTLEKSLSHVNEVFNAEFQIDFHFIYLGRAKHKMFVILDAGIRFGEATLVQSQNIEKFPVM